jgi:peroxiredoxin Q/BCP
MRSILARLILVAAILTAGLLAMAPAAREGTTDLDVGDTVSAFNANTHSGDLWQSAEHVGQGKYLVVYFYPAAMTGGCTKQACSYRDKAADLDGLDVEVVAVSGDSVNNLKIFKDAYNLNFPLLSDVNGYIARQFGVPANKGGSITRTVDGKDVVMTRSYTLARWTFILGKDGKVLYKDTSVDAGNDGRDAIAFLRSL